MKGNIPVLANLYCAEPYNNTVCDHRLLLLEAPMHPINFVQNTRPSPPFLRGPRPPKHARKPSTLSPVLLHIIGGRGVDTGGCDFHLGERREEWEERAGVKRASYGVSSARGARSRTAYSTAQVR